MGKLNEYGVRRYVAGRCRRTGSIPSAGLQLFLKIKLMVLVELIQVMF